MIVAVAAGTCLVVSLEVHKKPHLAEENNAISIAIGGRRGLGINWVELSDATRLSIEVDPQRQPPRSESDAKKRTPQKCAMVNLCYRRKFRSQTSDNMDKWKAEMERVREKKRVEERRSEKRKSQKKEDAGAPKGWKVAKHYVFRMICGSGGSKSRLARYDRYDR